MEPTFTNYVLFAYGAPFAIFAVLFVFMTVVNHRAHSFMIRTILGIELKSKNEDEDPPLGMPSQLADQVKTFLYVEPKDKKEPLPCIVRFLCDLFSSGILAVLIEIIFEKCVLSNTAPVVGDSCPDYKADCFGAYNGSRYFGPFQCIPGQNASFPVTSTNVDCYGWVYNDVSTEDVLDALGVTAGLLGLIACIIPLVYYISYFTKRYWWVSIICLILPLGTIGAFVAVILVTYPEVVSVLTIITFAILITMTSVGWIWALVSSCYFKGSSDSKDEPSSSEGEPSGSKNKPSGSENKPSGSENKPSDAKCCCGCSRSSWCLKPYTNYPWCCCKPAGGKIYPEQ